MFKAEANLSQQNAAIYCSKLKQISCKIKATCSKLKQIFPNKMLHVQS
jgi:hypothetical protein